MVETIRGGPGQGLRKAMPEPNIEGQKKRWLDRGDRVGPSYSGATSRTIIYSKMLIGVWQHTKYLLHLFPGI